MLEEGGLYDNVTQDILKIQSGPAYYHSCGYRNNDIKRYILIDWKAEFITWN